MPEIFHYTTHLEASRERALGGGLRGAFQPQRWTHVALVATLIGGGLGCMEAGDMWGELALPPLAAPIARGQPSELVPRAPDEMEAPPAPGTSIAKRAALPAKPVQPALRDAVKLAKTNAAKAAKARDAARRKRATRVVPLKAVAVAPDAIIGQAPAADFPLLAVFARIRQIASVGEVRYLRPWLSRRSLDVIEREYANSAVVPVAPRTLWQRIGGRVARIEYAGSRAIVTLERPQTTDKLTFYVERGTWRLDLAADARTIGPAPHKPSITLHEATAGIPGHGPLVAVFQTSVGRFRCALNEALAPETVTQFVGLARGKLGPVNAGGRVRRFYDGLRFHAAAPGKMIQSGDPTGTGVGHAGVTVRDEFDPKLRHDRAGVLALASAGPHTGSSQFYVTLAPAPRLDDRHAIFGLCRDLKVVRAIAKRAPSTVILEHVVIQRGF